MWIKELQLDLILSFFLYHRKDRLHALFNRKPGIIYSYFSAVLFLITIVQILETRELYLPDSFSYVNTMDISSFSTPN